MQWPAIQRWNDLWYPPVLSRIESNLIKSIKSLELGLVGTPQRKRFNFKKTRYVYPMVTHFLFRLQYPLDLDRAPNALDVEESTNQCKAPFMYWKNVKKSLWLYLKKGFEFK